VEPSVDAEMASLAEKLRSPLVSNDGRLVADDPGVEGGEDRVVLLRLTEVATDREARTVAFRTSDSPAARPNPILEALGILESQAWTALAEYESEPDSSGKERMHGLGSSMPTSSSGEGVRVRFHEPVLFVDVDGRSIFHRAFAAWSLTDRVGGEPCIR